MALVLNEQFGTIPSSGVQIVNLDGSGIHGSKSIVDSTPLNGSAAVINSSSTNISISKGSSLYFNGTTDYYTITDSNDFNFGSGDFTIECWMYIPANVTSTQVIVGQWLNMNNYSWNLCLISNNCIGVELSDTGVYGAYIDYVSSTNAYTANTWTHIAATRSGNTIRLFSNGTQVFSGSCTYSLFNSTDVVTVGKGDTTAGQYFNGYIDELRITKGIARYTSNFTVPNKDFGQYPASYTGDPYYTKTSLSLTGNGSNLSTSITDTSANAYVVTRTGNPIISTTQSKFGGSSLYFDGSSYLSVTVPGGLGTDFTIEYWLYLTSTGGYLFNSRTNGVDSDGIDIAWTGYTTTSGAAIVSLPGGTINSGAWYHVALVRDNTTHTMYVNGVSVATGVNATTWSGSSFKIGGSPYGNVGYITGYIDSFRVTSFAKYKANFTPPGEILDYLPTVTSDYDINYPYVSLLLHCDGANNNTSAIDASIYQKTLTRVGTPIISTAVYNTAINNTSAIVFDGSSYLTVIPKLQDIDFGASPYTIEGWVKFNSVSTSCTIASSSLIGSYWGWNIGQSGGSLKYWSSSNGTAHDIANGITFGSVNINQWYHIAVSRNAGNVYLFLNGNLNATIKCDTPIMDPGIMMVGSQLNGYIKQFKITRDIAKYASNFVVDTDHDRGDSEYANVGFLLKTQNSNIIDGSSIPKPITKYGAVAVDNTYTKFGSGSIVFNSISDYIDIPSVDLSSGSYTIEGWVRATADHNGDYYNILTVNNNANSSTRWLLDFGCVSGNITFRFVTESNSIVHNSTSTPYTYGTWLHFAFVNDVTANTLTYYINGVASGARAAVNLTNYSAMQIGKNSVYYASTVPYYIEDLRITKGITRYPSDSIPVKSLPQYYDNYQGDPEYYNVGFLLKTNGTDIVDNSVIPKQLTLTGSPSISSTVTKFGKSIYFNGSSSIKSESVYSIGAGDFTAEAWVFVPSSGFGSYNCIFDLRNTDGSSTGCALYVGNANNLTIANNSTPYSGGTLNLNSWNHIAIQRSSSTLAGFLNGVQVVSTLDTRTYTSNTPLIIGNSNSNQWFTGYIEDARLTIGVARYPGEIVPINSLPNDFDNYLDPYADKTVLLMNFNGKTFKDLSLAGNSVTSVGNPVISTSQKKFGNSSFYKDATTNNYITVPYTSSLDLVGTDFTIEAWINISSLSGNNMDIVNKDGRNNFTLSQYAIGINATGKFYGYTGDGQGISGGTQYIGSTTLSLNIWYHVAMVVKSGISYGFVNGSLEWTTSVGTFVANTRDLYIGYQMEQPSTSAFNGYIDEIRITRAARYQVDTNFSTNKVFVVGNTLGSSDSHLIDASPLGNTITYKTSNLLRTDYAKFGSASMYYGGSGTSSVATITNPNGIAFTGDFTIEFWMLCTTNAINQYIISSNVNDLAYAAWSWHIGTLSAGNLMMQIYDGSGVVGTVGNPSTPVFDGFWHHIAYVRSGSTITMYVDGVANGTMTYAGSMGINSATTTRSAVRLGAKLNATDGITCTNFYNGFLDGVRISGVARYTSAFTPSSQPFPNSATVINYPKTPLPIKNIQNTDYYFGNNALVLKFNGTNGSTTFTDSSLNTKTVTGNGTPTISTTRSRFGGSSLNLNGSSYLSIPNATGSDFDFGAGNFTAEAWIYNTLSNGAHETVFGVCDAAGGTIFALSIDDTDRKLKGVIRVGGSTFYGVWSSTTIPLNVWTHVAFCRNSNILAVYINGVISGTVACSGSIDVPNSSFIIGRFGDYITDNRYFDGYIDEVRITKGVCRYTSNFDVYGLQELPTAGEIHGSSLSITSGTKYTTSTQGGTYTGVHYRRHTGGIVLTKTTNDYALFDTKQPLRTSGEVEFELEITGKISTNITTGIHLTAGQARISNGFMAYINNGQVYAYTWNDATTAWTTPTGLCGFGANQSPLSNIKQDRVKLGLRWDYASTLCTVEFLINGTIVLACKVPVLASTFPGGVRPALNTYGTNHKVYGFKVWDAPTVPLGFFGGKAISYLYEGDNGNLDPSYSDTAATRVHKSIGFTYQRPSVVPKFGLGKISGTVKEKGIVNTPVKRRVVLMQDELKVAETWSDPSTGYYEFLYLDGNTQFTLLSYDHTGNFRAVIADRIYPVTTPLVLL